MQFLQTNPKHTSKLGSQPLQYLHAKLKHTLDLGLVTQPCNTWRQTLNTH
jgi:hypothetical protein